MPPNTANSNSDSVNVRKKGQQSTVNQANKNEKSDKTNAQLTKVKGLHPDFKVSVIIALIACLTVVLFPTILKQLAQLKRSFVKVPLDSRPIAKSSMVDPDTGVEYEYHQFMATVEQHFPNISLHEVPCNYKGYPREIQRGAPPRHCGTLILDELIANKSLNRLREMSRLYTTVIGDTNYHNRESYNLRWINLHHLFKYGVQDNIFNDDDFELIRNTSEAVKHAVCSTFGLPPSKVYFSPVSQFTRYKPVVPHSEFRHVDKVRSPYLLVTTILWLSTVDVDFGGGRTEFLTGGPEPLTPLLIEPKFGRFAAWTSGWENPHGVLEIEWGERLALIFAFTVHEDIGHESMVSLREWAMEHVPDRTEDELKEQYKNANSY